MTTGLCLLTDWVLNSDTIHGMHEDDKKTDSFQQQAVAEKPQLQEPPMYKVVILNDDYTPMDFVIEVLQMVFHMDESRATQIMLHVHTRGKGLCGIYSHEIAETKCAQVNDYAREHEHPLLCIVEPV